MICFLSSGAVAMALRMFCAILVRDVDSGIRIPAHREVAAVAHVDAAEGGR